MKYVLSGKEMKALDTYAIEKIGIPSLVLMENAANAVVSKVTESGRKSKILVISGMGNNGADGLAVYRILRIQGYDCDCILTGNEEKATKELLVQKNILEQLNLPVLGDEAETENYDIIIDAVFGVGLSRDVTGNYEKIIKKINSSNAYIISVDIPSGICAEDGRICNIAVNADCTVTFGYAKAGCILYPGKKNTGELLVKEIGYPKNLCEMIGAKAKYIQDEDLYILPKRDVDGNKGTFGKILLIAGSEKYCGAAILSCKAAYKMGAGMVKVITHENNRNVLCSNVPESLCFCYEHWDEALETELENGIRWADVIAVGPGISQSATAKNMLAFVLREHKNKTVILDADALNLMAEDENLKNMLDSNMVITPHIMEMARLTGKIPEEIKKNPEVTASEFAKDYGCIVVLKDAITVVSDSREVYYNTSGNSGMAVAGSGDVLTGILSVASVWKMPSLKRTAVSVYIHGRAGDMAAGKYGEHGMTSCNLMEGLELLYRELKGKKRGKENG